MDNGQCGITDVGCWLGWLRDELQELALWAWVSLVNGIAAFLEWLPVPEFLQNIGAFSLPDGVLYFLDLFMVSYGLAMVVGAYVLRFILRRIPLIG